MPHLTKAQRRAQKRGRLKARRERETFHTEKHDFLRWVKLWWASDVDEIVKEFSR